MAVLQEYKCPCCGGAITFDSTLQKMKCPYCDTEFEMETLVSYDDALKTAQADQMRWETEAGGVWQNGESDGLRVYVCKSCGGEIVADETTGASSCPYCDNPIVMMGQFAGELKPDFVIPFKLDKKAAVAALNRHYGGKKLLPKGYSRIKIISRKSRGYTSLCGSLMRTIFRKNHFPLCGIVLSALSSARLPHGS